MFGLLNGQATRDEVRLREMLPFVTLVRGDLQDLSSLIAALERSEPDEDYNLGAISFGELSFWQPELTANVTGVGEQRLLEAIRMVGGTQRNPLRLYQTSLSGMFGSPRTSPQNERVPFHPCSPYGVAKVFAHHLTVHCFAGDYVRATWLMHQQPKPDEYIVAAGQSHSVREALDLAADLAGVGRWEPFVRTDPRHLRPADVDALVGDASKAREVLGWHPQISFPELVALMVEADLELAVREANGAASASRRAEWSRVDGSRR